MAVDGLILNHAVNELKKACPMKIQRIMHISENEIVFSVRSQKEKLQLLISTHSVHNRIQFSQRDLVAASEPSSFVMLLRKHLDSAIIHDIKQVRLDRVCCLSIQKRDDLGDIHDYSLYVELMGKYANIVLVDENNKIVDALKRIPPYENNKRTIQSGANYEQVTDRDKLNPFLTESINLAENLTQICDGISPLLEKEIRYRIQNNESFVSIMNQIKQSKHLYLHPRNDDFLAHLIELKHTQTPATVYPFMEAYDRLYEEKENIERIKQHTGDLIKYVNREKSRNEKKIPKLLDSLDEAKDALKWKEMADYILAYGLHLKSGSKELEVEDFETSEKKIIALDPKFDGKTNAKRYYQKYHKGRKGVSYIEEQIEKTKLEVEYFELLAEQLNMASVADAIEIKEELMNLGYIPQKKSKSNKKHQLSYIHILTDDNKHIYCGKNNLQNDAITFKLAHKKDLWFHVKDYHGAHVVLASEDADEKHIRICAQLAAYYSKARNSSSVEVQYTPVSQLKKIPGAKAGMVQVGQYKTIFIDPDESFVVELIKTHKV